MKKLLYADDLALVANYKQELQETLEEWNGLREQGKRRRGRPRLRRDDCVKRDVKKTREEEDWKKKTRDRGGWKILSDEAVKKLRTAQHLTPDKGKKRKRGRASNTLV